MRLNVKRKLAIGTTAIAAAAFAGGAYAATQELGTSARQAFLNDVAKRLNVTPQQLSAALDGAYLDQLQAAVKSGRLTQAQANALKQRLQKSGTMPPLGGYWFGPLGGGRFFGPRRGGPNSGPPSLPAPGTSGAQRAPGAPGTSGAQRTPGAPGTSGAPGTPGAPGPGFHGFRRGFGPAGALAAAATYLEISDTQLFDQLRSGKSLAQITKNQNGKTVAGLEAALTDAVRSRLDKLVSAKMITAAQEQRILSELSARLDSEINATAVWPRWGQRARPGSRGPALLTPSQSPQQVSAD